MTLYYIGPSSAVSIAFLRREPLLQYSTLIPEIFLDVPSGLDPWCWVCRDEDPSYSKLCGHDTPATLHADGRTNGHNGIIRHTLVVFNVYKRLKKTETNFFYGTP